jgi:Zn-dependent protease
MNASNSWSISLGCWSGVQVRVHVTLPIIMLGALLMSELSIYRRASFPIERVVVIMILGALAVAAHAVSHLLTAARQGIDTKQLILAPWGEWNGLESPRAPEAALNLHLAGIMVNGFFCALSAMVLWLAGDTSISELLIPLDSRLLLQDDHLMTLRWVFCMNYCMVLVNLLPASPFDGSRVLKALFELTARHLSEDRVNLYVAITGRAVGIVLIVAAVLVGPGDLRGPFPAWFPLSLLGLVALFAKELEPRGRPAATTGLSQAKADLPAEEIPPLALGEPDSIDWEDGPFAQWLEEKRAFERARRKEAEQNDEQRTDEILARLHEHGAAALSAEDRKVLERVSDRLRRRKQEKA